MTTIFSAKGASAFKKQMGDLYVDVGPPDKPERSPYEE
jgi:hypothetical protein